MSQLQSKNAKRAAPIHSLQNLNLHHRGSLSVRLLSWCLLACVSVGVFEWRQSAIAGDRLPGSSDHESEILRTIRAAVREQFTSINSLELKFHQRDPQAGANLADCEWTISGNKFLLAVGPGPQVPNGPPSRNWFSFDGEKSYFIDFVPEDLAKVRSIARTSSFHPLYNALAIPPKLFGWRLATSDESLLAMLDRPGTHLLGKEDVDGHVCWKVDLGMISYKGRPTNRLTAWFDPEIGYWSRRLLSMPDIVPRPDGKPVTLADGQMPSDYVATDFARFDDQALGGQRWFPTRYKMVGLKRTIEVILDGIKINPSIPDARFTPEIPVGMLVTDEPGTPDQVSYYAGGDAGYEVYQKTVMEQAAVLSKFGPGNPLIDASVVDSRSWPKSLFFLSLIVAVVGCGLWWRARARA